MNGRTVLLLVLVVGVAGAFALLSSPKEAVKMPLPAPAAPGETVVATAAPGVPLATSGAREPFAKAAECRTCHETEYAEWQQSFHGKAWNDPMVQGLSNGFRMTECVDCHAPMPIYETGIGQRVAPRQHSRSDGVDCLTCHLMPDGVSVAATHTVDTSKVANACRPVEVKEMATPAACAGCHNQHFTVDEWAQSGVKETCADCHMPVVERGAAGATRKGRSHAWPGAHALDMHQKGATLDLKVEAGNVVAVVKNVGAGHQLPADARHRSYNLFLSAWDDRGNPLVSDKMIGEFRLYYRDDFKPSTQIAYGKTGEGRWPIPEGIPKGKVKVRLAYALNPEELAKKQVLTVFEKEIEFK
jgi:hypothetical protein